MSCSVDLKGSITMNTTRQIIQICKPLFNLIEINFFYFLRVYEDQGHICLTTNGEWNHYYYYDGLYKGGPHEYYNENDTDECNIIDLIIPSFSLNSYQKELNKGYQVFNLAHQFWITKKYKGYKDFFVLAARPENKNINSVYIKHFNEIEKFLNYFIIKATTLIDSAEKEKFYFPLSGEKLLKTSYLRSNKKSFPLKVFNQEIKLNKLPIKLDNEVLFLSKREIESLQGVIKGKSAKAIAKDMDISYRTVEAHIQSIRQKLKSNSISEIIDKIYSNEVIKKYLLNK